jgi:enoyl-CoA hydratase/carnithine racemase
MNTINIAYQDQVAVLKLDQGVTNPLNPEFIRELSHILLDITSSSKARSLVLTSASDKFFSIGFDIPAIYDLPREEFTTIYQAFNQVCLDLYTFPKPTVAAIKGHAIAGGTILALCCDYRFIAEGRKLMGLNEIHLGVPVPYLADLILNQVVGSRIARQIIESGDLYPAGELLELGLVDEVVPLDQVFPVAIEKASTLGEHPLQAFAMIKSNRVESISQQFSQRREVKEKAFIDRWYSPAARERLKAAMEKF